VAVLGTGVHVVWTDFRDDEYGEIYYMRDTTGNATAVEEATAGPERSAVRATFVRGVLNLDPPAHFTHYRLLDMAGRAVMSLHPGLNNVRHLAPGVYFLSTRGSSAATVIVVR
jgi:hypothetical protein